MDFLNIVEFNILRYDIPLLIQKGVEYSVRSLAELNKLWHNTFTIDYFQVTLPFHDIRFKNLNIGYLVEKARSGGIEVPKPYGFRGDIKDWYENGEYNEIIKHLEMNLKIIRVIDLNYKKVYGL